MAKVVVKIGEGVTIEGKAVAENEEIDDREPPSDLSVWQDGRLTHYVRRAPGVSTTSPRWIPVKERLPDKTLSETEKYMPYVVLTESGDVELAIWRDPHGGSWDNWAVASLWNIKEDPPEYWYQLPGVADVGDKP